MAPVTSRPAGHRAALALKWPDDVNVRRVPANAAEHDENVIVSRAGDTGEPVGPAYDYDLSYIPPALPALSSGSRSGAPKAGVTQVMERG